MLTHSLGPTLDFVVTKGLDVSTDVKDLSGHFCVFFDVSLSPVIQNRNDANTNYGPLSNPKRDASPI